MNRISVVAGIIYNPAGTDILISLRPASKHQGNLWEFPGGKVENGESHATALVRELKEEIGIEPIEITPAIQIRHDYPDKHVLLDVWRVIRFTGVPQGLESQEIRWVSIADLDNYEFPAANHKVLGVIQI